MILSPPDEKRILVFLDPVEKDANNQILYRQMKDPRSGRIVDVEYKTVNNSEYSKIEAKGGSIDRKKNKWKTDFFSYSDHCLCSCFYAQHYCQYQQKTDVYNHGEKSFDESSSLCCLCFPCFPCCTLFGPCRSSSELRQRLDYIDSPDTVLTEELSDRTFYYGCFQFLLSPLCLTGLFQMPTRKRIIEKYNLEEEDYCPQIILETCCCCFALGQEHSELDYWYDVGKNPVTVYFNETNNDKFCDLGDEGQSVVTITMTQEAEKELHELLAKEIKDKMH